MNTSVAISDERIYEILQWCNDCYALYSYKIQFPKGTDPSKTYQWRYLRSLAQKFEEWQFTDETIHKFLNITINHAYGLGILNQGLSVLHKNSMLEVCYKKLQTDIKQHEQNSGSVEFIHKWLKQTIGSKDPFVELTRRTRIDSYCNLTFWFASNKINPLYLALSKVCRRSLNVLTDQFPRERLQLPKDTTLYLLRTDFLSVAQNTTIFENLQDWD